MLTATVMFTAHALTNTQSAHDGEKGVKDEKIYCSKRTLILISVLVYAEGNQSRHR